MTEMETVFPVVTAQKLQSFEGNTEELANLGMKLAVGRIYARGKSFIPNIKRDLYDKIQAEVVRSQKEPERSGAEQVKASPAAPEGGSGTILTLRYRDYPKVPKFERHISTIALINPRPA